MDITVGILSGGKSSRMGKDKASLKYNGKTFLENLIKEFEDFPIIVSSNDPSLELPGLKIVRDEYKDIGPMGGILEILKHSQTENVFIVGVDMQFISKEVLYFLNSYINDEDNIITLEHEGKLNPLGSIYKKCLIHEIEERIENKNYKLMDMLYNEKTKKVPLEYSRFSKKVLSNINYQSEYKKLIGENIISICGVKNSGKTTFTTKVIEGLSNKGYKVKYIKHDGHEFDLDEKRDSNMAFESGAHSAVVYSDNKYQIVTRGSVDIDYFLKDSDSYDLVIIEGLKNSKFNKYEVIRWKNSKEVVSSEPILGIITDYKEIVCEKQIFDLNDPNEFINHIEKEYLLETRK